MMSNFLSSSIFLTRSDPWKTTTFMPSVNLAISFFH